MNLPEDMRKDIECPVCIQIPREIPIYQCENGHIICKNCQPRLEVCPQCRIFVGHTRSLIAEKLVSKIQHKCKFAECVEERLLEDLQKHEDNCVFREFRCITRDCNEKMRLDNWIQHFQTYHSKFNFHMSNFLYEPIYLHTDYTDQHVDIIQSKQHFFLVLTELQSGFLAMYIFILGSQENRDKYDCSVKISRGTENPDQDQVFMDCKGYINVIDNSEKVPCITLHPSQLKHYFDHYTDHIISAICLTISVQSKDILNDENGVDKEEQSDDEPDEPTVYVNEEWLQHLKASEEDVIENEESNELNFAFDESMFEIEEDEVDTNSECTCNSSVTSDQNNEKDLPVACVKENTEKWSRKTDLVHNSTFIDLNSSDEEREEIDQIQISELEVWAEGLK